MNRMDLRDIDDYLLLLNLYLTQGLTLLVGLVLYYWFYIRRGVNLDHVFTQSDVIPSITAGVCLALMIIIINIIMERLLPAKFFDDGGINEKLFAERSLIHIVFIAFIVALSEEFLFRVVIQPLLGLWWTSVLFTVIHVRYLGNWVMPLFVFAVSLSLGGLYIWSENAWAPVTTHFLVDMVMASIIRFRLLYNRKPS